MGKVYDVNGVKMNVAEICSEVIKIMPADIKTKMAESINGYIDVSPDRTLQYCIAHSILDNYSSIESTTESGTRLRKLCDNIMTRYQKSTTNASTEDMVVYHDLAEVITGRRIGQDGSKISE